ncbi:MAG TPA: patatin-like phospholipase family protein [Hyphomonas sp.]|nr:patatin-like phospholipase family protein [Hyphomonas sp.]MCC0017536.1 patatin-like phospholipase family protein [Rhodobiaceae bacterium]MCA8905678.1 patatin-like phospholipase family protein [Hyphomonas sp.]MCB9961805.1 patatin-like phospholipase family protein [Hyphomonas sp.]MCB9972700.1 patatin-like phospholipase family protein [Hyphomonas sp.]
MFARLMLVLLCAVSVTACAGTRKGTYASCRAGYEVSGPFNADEDRRAGGIADSSSVYLDLHGAVPPGNSTSLDNSISDRMERAKGNKRNYNALLLSTGGAWGSYGAAFLRELAETGKLPAYDLVTGASTGSIIAPFAFIGDTKALKEADSIYAGLSDTGLVRKRGPFELIWSSSLYDTKGLQKKIEDEIEELDVVQRVIDRSMPGTADEGRVLAIATVNMDTGMVETYDLTAIAHSDLKHSEKERRFAEIILASTAIPLAFEPIYFDNGCMYLDAGLRQNLFMTSELVAANARALGLWVNDSPSSFGGRNFRVQAAVGIISDEPEVRVALDMIVNGNGYVGTGPSGDTVVSKGLIPIARRSMNIVNDTATWAAVSRTREIAMLMNWKEIRYQDAAQVSLSGLNKDAVFDPAMIAQLRAAGKQAAGENEPWRTVPTSPDPGLAPFVRNDFVPPDG